MLKLIFLPDNEMLSEIKLLRLAAAEKSSRLTGFRLEAKSPVALCAGVCAVPVVNSRIKVEKFTPAHSPNNKP